MKNVLIFLILVGLGAAGYWYMTNKPPREPQPEPEVEVKFTTKSVEPSYIQLPVGDSEYAIDGTAYAAGTKVKLPAGRHRVWSLDGNRFGKTEIMLSEGDSAEVTMNWQTFQPAETTYSYHGDIDRRGHIDLEVADELMPTWQVEIGQRVRAAPIAVDGVVYVATRDLQLVAFDAQTGQRLWQGADIGSDTPAAVVGDYVFAANDRGSLDAYRIKDGKKKGELGLGSFATSLTATPQGLLTLTAEGSVHLLKTEKSLFGKVPMKEKWRRDWELLGGRVSHPTIGGDVALTQTEFDELLAFSLESGAELWRHGMGSDASPAQGDIQFDFSGQDTSTTPAPTWTGESFVCVMVQELVAFSAQGNEIWRTSTAKKPSTSVACAFDIGYLGLENGQLLAFDITSGDEIWRANCDDKGLVASPMIAGKHVVILTSDGEFQLRHPLSGKKLQARNDLKDRVSTCPAISKDGVVAVSDRGLMINYAR